MAITTLDGLIAALGASTVQRAVLNKASISTQATSGFSSLWRATGVPTQGAIPGAAATPDDTTTGSLLTITNPGGSETMYLALANLANATNSAMVFELHDRIGHMGGLSGVTTGNQTVNLSVVSVAAARKGDSNYSDVQWWAEIYTDIGTTGQTCTVTYTNAGGTGGQTTTFTLGGASPANQDSRIFPIFGANGEFIQSVQTVSIATTTGTAGSWGITATRKIATLPTVILNKAENFDWAKLGLAVVPPDACLFGINLCSTTSTGNWVGDFAICQG